MRTLRRWPGMDRFLTDQAGRGGDHADEPGGLAEPGDEPAGVGVVHGTSTLRGTLAAFGRDLGFPDYYGVNLDALTDCLRDLDPAGRGTTLVWRHAALLRAADWRGYRAIRAVLGAAEDEAHGRGESLDVVVVLE